MGSGPVTDSTTRYETMSWNSFWEVVGAVCGLRVVGFGPITGLATGYGYKCGPGLKWSLWTGYGASGPPKRLFLCFCNYIPNFLQIQFRKFRKYK